MNNNTSCYKIRNCGDMIASTNFKVIKCSAAVVMVTK